MAEFQDYLAILTTDPGDAQALAAIESMGEAMGETAFENPDVSGALDEIRRSLRERGALEVVARLFDVEINAVSDDTRRADLLLEKGHLLSDDLLQDDSAVECFNRVLALRPDDENAQETLAQIGLVRDNWRNFVDKYLAEARVSTDRQLTTSLYLSAAETCARYEPESAEVESYLRKALEVDQRNRKAALHLERLLRRSERWSELVDLLQQRVDAAVTKEERIQALLGIADVAKARLDQPQLAIETMKKVVAADPAHPRALRLLADAYEREENWSALVMLYTSALKARRRGPGDQELGVLLQIAMLHWRRLENLDAAEEYFRRIRKVEPAHPAALDFYRTYYPARGETAKLLQVLRQSQKSLPAEDTDRRLELSVEIARVAEDQLGNPEKAIDAWKAIVRAAPDAASAGEARAALKRLYRKTEKWNALLDMMKEEIERLPEDDVAGRVERLMDVVAIYRDRLKLDVMVINTYNSILKLDPGNRQALDDLAEKYKDLGRWNDLIAVLGRKAELPDASPQARADILREIASLWSDRFGNYAQAIKPLEQLLDLVPDDADAIARLKEIYSRRRQWRGLINLLGREADVLAPEERRDKIAEMARLAAERLGDNRLAIELWNRVLELPGAEQDERALAALAYLYEREKRYLALADVYRRQRELVGDDRAAALPILEKLGALLADRLQAPAQAAEVFEEILGLRPDHTRALRTLRELYASASDYAALERLYGRVGQWDELVDSFFNIADRESSRDKKLELLERSAAIAAEHFDNADKIARAYERILSVEPEHLTAARALVPVYEKTHKWARLLSTYEVLLAHAETDQERLQLHLKIRNLCERNLGSKALAFQWTARAYELSPQDDALLADLERLGAEADQWDEVARILDRRVSAEDVDDGTRLRLLRELGRIAAVRLHKPEKAREYQRRVLELAPDDPAAMAALEDIATQLSEWPDLLKVYRRRSELEKDEAARVDLLFKIAFIEEERVADLDAAAGTYERILEVRAGSQRALRALSKIHEARGDWQGLARVVERDLAHAVDDDARVELQLRLAALYEGNLDRPADALGVLHSALDLAPARSQVHRALERFLDGDGPAARVSGEERVAVARRLLPIYENAEDAARVARALEVLRAAADDAERVDYDRRLATVYGEKLGRPEEAYAAALRVLEADPADAGNRAALTRYADALGRYEELAETLAVAFELVADAGQVVRKAMASELAELYDQRLQRAAEAENAWLTVLDIDSADQSAYDALDRIYRNGERWKDLRDLLLRREDNTFDGMHRKEILLAICDLEEGVLDNPGGAVDAYRRVLEIDPAMMRAYKALERLYAEKQRWSDLEALLGRELDHVDDEEHVKLTFRRAEIRARHLSDPQGAVDLLEDVVARRPGHADARELLEELLPNAELRMRIARVLEPIYQRDGLWRDLCVVLRAQREFAGTALEAAELLARVAEIEEEHLGHNRGAFDTWVDALTCAPADLRAREAVRRLGAALDRWQDVAIAYETALEALDAGDLAVRGELLSELAAVYDVQLSDADSATSAYRRLLDLDPGNLEIGAGAARALARLYEQSEQWLELIEIVRRQADWADNTDDRKELLARVALINEEQLSDKEAAISTWREVLTEDPEDVRSLDALERLYSADERHHELIEIIRRRVELAADPQERKVHLRRIAALYERELSNPVEAVAAHLEIIDHLPDDRETLAELARLYAADQRYTDLLEIVERQHSLAEDLTEEVALTYEIGRLLRDHLQRAGEALERFAEVLARQPEHAEATRALEAMLADDDLSVRAGEILQPHYEAAGEYEKLAGLLLRVADGIDIPQEKLRNLRRVAQLREDVLDDKQGAFEVLTKAVRSALAEPELPELLTQLERLASDLGHEGDLIDIYQEIAPDVLDGDLQRRLYLDVADLARAVRQDTDLARDNYRRVLDSQPDDLRALSALESIYREAGEHARLYDMLIRKADLLGGDLDARALALTEAAELCAEHLGRPEDAIQAWEQVVEIAPENKKAAAALEKLYEGGGRWHDLVELLERRLGFAFTVEEAVVLRTRLGTINEQHLNDPDAAVENFAAALGGDPSNATATAALERYLDDPGTRGTAAEVLEPIYVSHQDWPKLVRIYEIKLEAADDPRERLQLTRYIARLYEDQLEDLEGAFRWYGRVFREDPSDGALRDQLLRLAHILENWQGLANIYQEYLDDVAGDGPETRAAALALAEIYDQRLDEVELGQAAYRRVLSATPDDLGTFRKLEAMLSRAERWYALVDVYEDAITSTLDDARRIELFGKKARVNEERLGDFNAAIDAYRAVLEIDPAERAAADQLERLYTEQSMWFELADLYNARIERADTTADDNDLRLRLAKVLEQRLSDTGGAIDQYEVVLRSGEGWEQAMQPLERLILVEEHRERIAELLEPVYRANDWWQKLVVILDAQLQYVDEPERRVGMLREIAQLHETRGGDLALALDALARAWRENVADDDVYDELSVLAAKLGAWDDLVETLRGGLTDLYDFELVATLWRRIAEIHELQRADAAAAIDAWRKVLEAVADDDGALVALDRLLGQERRHEDLARILERRAELADDPAERVALLHRMAAVQENELKSVADAVATYKNVLTVDEADGVALDALDRLYRAEGDHAELANILVRKIELATDAAARRALRLDACTVYDEKLSDPYEAIAHLNAILDEDLGDQEALAALDRLYQREAMWPELLDILDRRVALVGDAERAEIAFRAARVVEKELIEPEQAIGRYEGVLDLDPGHPEARAALDAMTRSEDTLERAAEVLERLYRRDGAFDQLAELYERKLAMPSPDPDRRREQFVALAEIHETSRADLDAAFRTWARALAEAPEDEHVIGQLERLAASQGSWEQLAKLLEERLGDIVDAELEYDYATRVARLYEEAIGDLERAADKYRQALAVASDERPALAALDRIYGRAGRWPELAEILAREAEATLDETEQAELLFRLGDLREVSLEDTHAAVEAYRDVLERSPRHAAARGALERLLTSAEDERSEIIAILEPLYESEGDWVRLIDLLGAKLGVTDDNLDRAQIYMRIADLAEHQLGDPVRALDASGGWLAEDPHAEQALGELERLAEQTGRWADVAARLQGICASTELDPDLVRPLLLRLGGVQKRRLGDSDGAEATYRRVLENEPEATAALDALAEIYRERFEAEKLVEIVWKRAGLAFDMGEKRTYLIEAARLREQLEELDGAEEAWREVLDLDEGDREAHGELARLYEQRQKWEELIDILSVAARFPASGDEERALRVRIARIYGETLDRLEEAVDAWQAVIDIAPDDFDALAALEAVHRKREDWLAVQEILVRRLEQIDGNAARIAIFHQLAELAENQRESLDEAIGYLFQVLDLDNAHLETYARLERLLGKGERWHDIVELLERQADVHGTLGDGEREIDCLARAADVWEGPLENEDAAGELLEKILAREPNYVPALTRLAKIYEKNHDWERCGEILQKALALGPSGRAAADLYYRLGEVARQQSGDEDQALAYWQQALGYDATHPQAVEAVERVARERQDWPTAADMLRRRLEMAEGEDQKLELTLELATIYSEELRDPGAVIPLLESAVSLAPDDPRVLAPLADLYFAAGRHADATPIYERLADEAKKSRKMKDVARYRQRLAGIFEAAGETDKALAAYEEAFRVNPTDVATMAGLGRIYMNRQVWDKARRVYRSLVLQNVDPKLGITKAEVYLNLGVIHRELGENQKAKGMFQRGLEIEPDHQQLKAALEALG